MEILRYQDLHNGGFAGLEERRFVTDSRVFGRYRERDAVEGLGNFVYLADANFLPNGETGLHPHREIDVISVMVEGRIDHAGSLENGESIEAGMVQIQRAGGDGFTHNEINPDDAENQMIQLWIKPDVSGQSADYQVHEVLPGERKHVYGGQKGETERLDNATSVDVAILSAGQRIAHQGEFMAYVCRGSGTANGETIDSRCLLRGEDLEFIADSETQIILIYGTDAGLNGTSPRCAMRRQFVFFCGRE